MATPWKSAVLLPFDPKRSAGGGAVGCVLADGSVVFRGVRYRTITQLPPECASFRADLASTVQWRRLYRAVDPARKR